MAEVLKRKFEEPDENLDWVNQLSVQELKEELKARKVGIQDAVEKEELIKRLKEKLQKDILEGIPTKKKVSVSRRDCPYLDTVNRSLLDFDFEKLCSVTLQNLNIYACLVCGKYFQGRGRNSQAYVHSLQANHHVFINLHNEKTYCLPDDYEVIDSSLNDIKSVLNPKFTKEQIENFDTVIKPSQSLDGREYYPGYIGLNNLGHTDPINSVIQALSHVALLRNFFCIADNYSHVKDPLVHTFGELIRKMYNPLNFKGQVDPHEFLQAVSVASEKKFKIGILGDPTDFIQFLLNHIHLALGGRKKSNSSIIFQSFQGQVEVVTQSKSGSISIQQNPFLLLSVDLPPPPLFKDEQEKNIIPQVPIYNVLTKFDGHTQTYIDKTGETKTFRILKLPRYLILHIKRFTKNNWFREKNPTIVNFPLANLDLKDYLKDPSSDPNTKYNLVANICHEGEPDKGSYRVHILCKPRRSWYEIQDLTVKEILPQLIALSESYLQIYEKQSSF